MSRESPTIGPVSRRLLDLADAVYAAENSARMMKPDSPQALRLQAVRAEYDETVIGIVRDFELMLTLTMNRSRGIDAIVSAVAAKLVDSLDFDAVKRQADHCHKMIQSLRHEVEDLRKHNGIQGPHSNVQGANGDGRKDERRTSHGKVHRADLQ